jgi:hypothetical protein
MIDKPIKITDELLKRHFPIPAVGEKSQDMILAERTAELADKWARVAIEATLGSPEKYWQAFKRVRVIIAAAIEEDRNAA